MRSIQKRERPERGWENYERYGFRLLKGRWHGRRRFCYWHGTEIGT